MARAGILAVGLAGAMVLTGCVVERRVYVPSPPPPGVDVTVIPPVAQAETIPPAPAPTYIWMGGYWSWNGTWIWVPGRWVLPPRPGVVWEPGVWVRINGGWRWRPGYWR
jgi:hypothetical protein